MTALSDTFNRANSAALGANWTETEGIAIASNKAEFQRSGSTIKYARSRHNTPLATTAQQVSVTCQPSANNANHTGGPIIRWELSGPGSYLYIDYRGSGPARLAKVVDGAFTLISSDIFALSPVTTTEITMTAIGSALTVTAPGQTPYNYTITDPELLTGKYVGIQASSRYDNAFTFDNWTAADVTTQNIGRWNGSALALGTPARWNGSALADGVLTRVP